jgi:hypothetical protein
VALIPENAGTIAAPNSTTAETAGSVAIPNSTTAETAGTVAIPNSTTPETAGSVAIPNSTAAETAGSVAIPNSVTAETAGSVAIPNATTAETAGSVAIPNSVTSETAGSVAIPNSTTAETAGSVATPNSVTAESATTFPRSLTPKIAFDFADNLYSLCGVPKSLTDITTYTRASSASFVNRRINGCSGRYEYFLDTDYVGTVTNLFTYSEQFDNADWTKGDASVTANAALDPFGGRAADKLAADSTGTIKPEIFQTVTSTVSQKYTSTFYVKSAEVHLVQISYFSGDVANNPRANFNLSTGELGSVDADIVASISSVGDGWYRITSTVTALTTTTLTVLQLIKSASEARGQSNAWTSGDGVYIYGAQVTESAKPLPYVATTSASAAETFSESVRLEYDAATGDALGALIEGASTNLCLRSEEFDNASWTKTKTSVAANVVIAPDGTKSADKLIQNGEASSSFYAIQSITVTTNPHTFSVYAKAGENSWIMVYFSGGFEGGTYFNLATGEVGSNLGNAPSSSSIKNCGNGWYRCSITITPPDTSALPAIYIAEGDGDITINGDSTSGVYLWGAQVEELPFPSSYIRTGGSSVSRSADLIVSGNLGTFNTATLHAEIDALGTPSSPAYSVMLGSGATDYLAMLIDSSGVPNIRFYGYTSSSTVMDYTDSASLTENSVKGTITSGRINDMKMYSGGAIVSTDTINTIPDIDSVRIGSNYSNGQAFFGHVKELKAYDQVLTASEVSLL